MTQLVLSVGSEMLPIGIRLSRENRDMLGE
jgi:hypothetical protein